MLKRDYKVVVVIPAGHFPDIEILLNNLNKQEMFDECEVWMNCNPRDIEPIKRLVQRFSFARCVYPQWPERSIAGIARFLNRCRHKYTLYIRLDNDICYLAKDAIKNLVVYKLHHPNQFLTYANCVNNDITSHFYQQKGLVPPQFGRFDCRYGNLARHSPHWMLYLHRKFIVDCMNNLVNNYRIRHIEYDSARFGCPVNTVCWLGKDFSRYGNVHGNEETYLMTRKATNGICGNSIMCHFKYQSQIQRFNKQQWKQYHDLQKEYMLLSLT